MVPARPEGSAERAVWPWIFGCGAALFAVLAAVVAIRGVLPVERAIQHWLLRDASPAVDFFAFLGALGGKAWLACAAALLALALPTRGRRRLWLLIAVLALAWGLEELAEGLVARAGPQGTGVRIPSGSAAGAAAFYVFAAYLLQGELKRGAARTILWLLTGGFVVAVLIGGVLAQAQLPLDAMGGALLGLSCAAAAAWWDATRRTALAAAPGAEARPYALDLVYRAYEVRLLRQIRRGPMPRHVGVVIDGNRRYGALKGMAHPRAAYEMGAQRLDDLLDWCTALGIPTVTLWVLSTDNFARGPEAVAGILGAVEAKLSALSHAPQTHQRRIRVRAIGRLALLPRETLAAIRAVEAATAGYDGLELNIAIGYGGREEIADAVRKLVKQRLERGAPPADLLDSITPEEIARHLYMADSPDPDLIIRTSGEVRLSGFLLWQSAYSEYYFCDVYWPAYRKIDFLRALRSFQERDRRFGR